MYTIVVVVDDIVTDDDICTICYIDTIFCMIKDFVVDDVYVCCCVYYCDPIFVTIVDIVSVDKYVF